MKSVLALLKDMVLTINIDRKNGHRKTVFFMAAMFLLSMTLIFFGLLKQ